MQDLKKMQVGSRIYYPGNMANADDEGTVVKMSQPASGKPPETLGGGVVVVVSQSTPSAKIEIVLDDGRSLSADEHMFHGLRPWKLLDEVVDDQAVADAIARGEAYSASQRAKKRADDEAHEAEKIRLGKENPDLVRSADDHNAAQKNLRKLLKKEFPSVKFSVRRPRGSSIDVTVPQGALDDDGLERVKSICGLFEAGHFDGMTDSYCYRRSAWTSLFGSSQFVFLNVR